MGLARAQSSEAAILALWFLFLFIKGKPRQAKDSAAGKPDCLEISFRSSKESLVSHKETSGNHEGTRKQCDSNPARHHCAHKRVEASELIDSFVSFSKFLVVVTICFLSQFVLQ